MSALAPLPLKDLSSLDTRQVWAALTEAHRHLAELKGLCESLPNQAILLDTLGIQEAKDSSEIENIITTHDELYAVRPDSSTSAASKEVRHYVSALRVGFDAVRTEGSAVGLVKALRDLMLRTKHGIREKLPKIYSQDLLNILFRYPYTKTEYVEKELGVSRITAAKYLEQLVAGGVVRKQRIGKNKFYINEPLFILLSGVTLEQV